MNVFFNVYFFSPTVVYDINIEFSGENHFLRGVGRSQILSGHTFSNSLSFRKILGGPVPTGLFLRVCSYGPVFLTLRSEGKRFPSLN